MTGWEGPSVSPAMLESPCVHLLWAGQSEGQDSCRLVPDPSTAPRLGHSLGLDT